MNLFTRPIRQWVVLLALVLGLTAAGLGTLAGRPNSWEWFAAGVVVAIIAALESRRRRLVRRRAD